MAADDFSNFMKLLQPKMTEEQINEIDQALYHKVCYDKMSRFVNEPIIVIMNHSPYIKLGFGLRTFAHPENEQPCLEFKDYSNEESIGIDFVRYGLNVSRFSGILLNAYCKLTELEFSLINFPNQGKNRKIHSRIKLVGIADDLLYRNGFFNHAAKHNIRKRHGPS